ncbi:alpha/beta hydrolase fold domain-containing protein [Sarocladium implicatum]|nr:alpha/beta hydrolase fold domain-containing protein [Sarocladium implicatum]
MAASEELFVTLPSRVRICYKTYGNPSDPPAIFVNGATGGIHDWPVAFLPLLSPPDNPHFVVLFDHRDVGLSTEFPVPANYTLLDMAGDVEGLIRHLDVGPCHIMGASLGGPIAWTVAARSPELVRTLTLVYTTTGISPELPMAKANQEANVGVMPFVGGADARKSFIDSGIRAMDFHATEPVEGEERERRIKSIKFIVEREAKAGTLYSKGPNHGSASAEGWPKELLADVKCPATVIQAGKDQYFGPEHGQALVAAIPGDVDYVLWEDVGHEFPKRCWDRFAQVLLRTWARG